MTNPFQLVHDALWEALEARDSITTLVPAGNRHKFDTASVPTNAPRTKDSPEIRIVPTTGVFNLHVTNADTELTKRWDIQVITQKGAVTDMELLEFEILRAVLAMDFDDLEWEGKSFVQNVLVVSAAESLLPSAQGVAGWATVITCVVSMIFATETLIAV